MQLRPPTPLPTAFDRPTVFLAGSIELGEAEDWQARVAAVLAPLGVVVLNPRREAWDASWEQRLRFAPFREQVEWELDALARADLVLMHFVPTTRAPVTLLELGLLASSGKLIVSCPDGYWRKGNVEVVCARFGIPLLPDLDAALARLRVKLGPC
ncbi:MAG: nucleoside 2-deoxyribosyltransferase domain-containing protein [Myxococcaceae bacterium]|nr:nucleoside 2-deoxyribosyltransferase domain-containing protein [Myxococcaceae bacterium]